MLNLAALYHRGHKLTYYVGDERDILMLGDVVILDTQYGVDKLDTLVDKIPADTSDEITDEEREMFLDYFETS